MHNKKSQAAMEFLMTYGWAILVVIVAISALAYFGVLDFQKWLPQKCIISPGIHCGDHEVYKEIISQNFKISLRNNYGKKLTIEFIEVNEPYDYVGGGPEENIPSCKDDGGVNTLDLSNNEQLLCTLNSFRLIGPFPVPKGKYQIEFTVEAFVVESGLTQNFQGTATGYYDGN